MLGLTRHVARAADEEKPSHPREFAPTPRAAGIEIFGDGTGSASSKTLHSFAALAYLGQR